MSNAMIDAMLRPLRMAVGNMITRAVVVMVNAAAKQQTVQVKLLSGEGKGKVENFEQYGFTSNPHPGAEGLGLFVRGDRSHGVVILIGDRRYRLTGLEEGEAALYDDLGQKVHLTRNGIEIYSEMDVSLRGRHVRIHGNESLIIECNGHGEKWFPNKKDTYTIGAVAGSSNPINAPEIP